MLKRLYNISEVIVKMSYEIFRTFLIGIMIIGLVFMVDQQIFSPHMVFVVCLLNYAVSYALAHFLNRKYSIDSRQRLMYFVMSIILPIVSTQLFVGSYFLSEKIGIFILQIFIWKKSMDSYIEELDMLAYKSSFFKSLLLMLAGVIAFWIFGKSQWYISLLKSYMLIYVVISLIFLSRVNLNTAYNEKNKNVINKSKNIILFNSISTIIVLILMIFTLTNYFGLQNNSVIYNFLISFFNVFFDKVLSVIFYPVAWILVKLTELFKTHAKINIFEIMSENLTRNEMQLPDESNANYAFTAILNRIIEFSKWLIIGIVILAIVYYIYKNLRQMYNKNKENDEVGEEKEFILTVDDLKKGLKKPFSNLLNNLSSLFSKRDLNLKDLPVARRIYVEVVLKLSKDGNEYKKHLTPNEYLKTIDDKIIDAGFSKLTRYYNDAKYGLKELNEEEKNEALKIKDNILNK